MKVGGEYVYQQNPVFLCNRCMGIYDAQGGAVPANIESLFPVWNDVSTWNLAALSPIVRSYTLGVGQMQQYAPLNIVSGWVQDDWQLGSRLTLNLGAPLRPGGRRVRRGHRARAVPRRPGGRTTPTTRAARSARPSA